MSSMIEMREKRRDLGFSDEELLRMWFETYVLSTQKEDVHAKFANLLCCTRNDAKAFHYILLYTNPYLKYILRNEGISRLEQAKRMVTVRPDKIMAENAIENHLNFLEKLNDTYIEKYRTITPEFV